MRTHFPKTPTSAEIQDFTTHFESMIAHNIPLHHVLDTAGESLYLSRSNRRVLSDESTRADTMIEALYLAAPYMATDTHGQIHWIHPVLRDQLSAQILPQLNGPAKRTFKAALARLDMRHKQTEQLRQKLLSIAPGQDKEQHYADLCTHIERAKVCPIMAWNLLRIHTPMARFLHNTPRMLPLQQAEILSHFLSDHTPAPDKKDALNAYVALRCGGSTLGTGQAVATVAAAQKCGVLPQTREQANTDSDCAFAVLLADIGDGDLARKAYDHHENLMDIPPEQGRKNLAFFIKRSLEQHAFTAHQILKILHTANSALKSIGTTLPLTIDDCGGANLRQ